MLDYLKIDHLKSRSTYRTTVSSDAAVGTTRQRLIEAARIGGATTESELFFIDLLPFHSSDMDLFVSTSFSLNSTLAASAVTNCIEFGNSIDIDRICVLDFEGSIESSRTARTYARPNRSTRQRETVELLNLIYTRAPDVKDRDIVNSIGLINKLLSKNCFNEVNDVIGAANPTIVALEFVISLLRSTFPARNKLGNWRAFLLAASSEVSRNNRDPRKVFRGLCDAR